MQNAGNFLEDVDAGVSLPLHVSRVQGDGVFTRAGDAAEWPDIERNFRDGRHFTSPAEQRPTHRMRRLPHQGLRIRDDVVEGDVALAFAAVRQGIQGGRLENPEDVLAKLPAPIQRAASLPTERSN